MQNHNCRVLLIEDHVGDARLVHEEFSAHDQIDITHVNRLAAGMDYLQRIDDGECDLVILDLTLPDARGIDSLKAIRTCTADLPIVILTGHHDDSVARNCEAIGIAGYLSKDAWQPGELYAAVQKALESCPQASPEASPAASSFQKDSSTSAPEAHLDLQQDSPSRNVFLSQMERGPLPQNRKLADEAASGEGKLPFHIPTLLNGIWQKHRWVAAILVIGPMLGITCALLFGKRTWSTAAVMQYQPWSDNTSLQSTEVPLLKTQLHLVKVRANLEETRVRLALPCTIGALGASCKVHTPQGSELLIVQAKWGDAEECRDIANTLTEVFLDAHRRQRREELRDSLRTLAGKIRSARQLRGAAQAGLAQQAGSQGRDDRERQLRRFDDELRETRLQRRKAESEIKAIESQIEKLIAIQDGVKQRISSEKAAVAGLHNLAHLNIRVERIRAKIRDRRTQNVNAVELDQWKARIDHSKKMLDRGFISRAHHDGEMALYKAFLLKSTDSGAIESLKKELEELYSKFSPTTAPTTASAPIMRDLLLQQYNLDLKYVGAHSRLKELIDAEKQAMAKIASLTNSTGSVDELLREIEYWDQQRRELEDEADRLQLLLREDPSHFQVVSSADRPVIPVGSTRNALAAGVSLLLILFGLAGVIAVVVLDTSIKSEGEVALHLQMPCLGLIPLHNKTRGLLLGSEEEVACEQYRMLAHHLRQHTPKSCKRLFVTSCMSNEGRTTIVANLAVQLAAHGDRVLVVDADFRPGSDPAQLGDLIPDDNLIRPGLEDVLVDPEQSWQKVLYPTKNARVECLPRGTDRGAFDLLGSRRLNEVFSQLADRYDWILVDGAPVFPYADAEWTTDVMDAAVLVVLVGGYRASLVKAAKEAIVETGLPMIGAILNGMDPRERIFRRRPSPKKRASASLQHSRYPSSAAANSNTTNSNTENSITPSSKTLFRLSAFSAFAYWVCLLLATHWNQGWGEATGFALEHDKFMHFGAYGVLAMLALPVVRGLCRHWNIANERLRKQLPLIVTCLAITLYGGIDELTQPFFGRTADMADYMADLLGMAVGLFAFSIGSARLAAASLRRRQSLTTG